jgi:hypothetical protein
MPMLVRPPLKHDPSEPILPPVMNNIDGYLDKTSLASFWCMMSPPPTCSMSVPQLQTHVCGLNHTQYLIDEATWTENESWQAYVAILGVLSCALLASVLIWMSLFWTLKKGSNNVTQDAIQPAVATWVGKPAISSRLATPCSFIRVRLGDTLEQLKETSRPLIFRPLLTVLSDSVWSN